MTRDEDLAAAKLRATAEYLRSLARVEERRSSSQLLVVGYLKAAESLDQSALALEDEPLPFG